MTGARIIWFAVWCASLSLLAWAPPVAADCCKTPWYGDHERGWFWYEKDPEPELEEELWPPPEIVSIPQPAEPKPAEAQALSADWIKKYLEVFKNKAIDDPSPENVAAYLYIQRVMMDKSQRFAEQVANVVRADPYLDQNTRRPIATFGNIHFAQEAQAARKELLVKIAQRVGLFFFFQSQCKQCEIQAPVLKSLQERYGFVIFPISVGGEPLANGMYLNYATDQGQARALGVVKTPAMFLGRPAGKEIIPLGQNTLARDQLEGNILAAARDAGWITPAEFNRAQGMDSTLALDLKQDDMPSGLSGEEAVEYIKSLYRGLGESRE